MPPVEATIHNTLGVLFVVSLLTAALYGAGMLQGWFYFRRYNKSDHWSVRLLVGFVLICDTVQEALICAAVYQYAVTMHDDPLAMTRMEKTIIVELFFGGALAFAVQTFYCWRILRLSKNYFLGGIVWMICLGSAVSIFVYTCITIGYHSLGDLLIQRRFATALNSLNAISDVSISLAMIYCLQTSKTGFKNSTDIINRLIIFTFNTGIPTSLFALLDVIFLNAMPLTFLYMGMYLLMDRFYTNCLLVTLNSRKYIRHGSSEETHESIQLQSRNGTTNPTYTIEPYSKKGDPISIRIDQSTHVTEAGHEADYAYDSDKTTKDAENL